jgi:hypothetical protein
MSIFNDNIVLNISRLLNEPIDRNKIITDIEEAARKHPYTRRTPVWLSVPLRSVGGEIGEKASGSTGIYNSSDETLYENTEVMQPYIKSIIDQIGAPLLKVRILKLKSGASITEHVDSFQSDDIFRFHIPVITHPSVEFWLDGHPYYIPSGQLCYLNVRKKHKVLNKSKIDRIHIVFDVKSTPELEQRVKECAVKIDPWF